MEFEPITSKVEKTMKYATVRSIIHLKNGVALLSSNSKETEVHSCGVCRIVLNPDWLKKEKQVQKWIAATINDDEIERIEEFSAMNPIDSMSEPPDGVVLTFQTDFQDAFQNKISVVYEKDRQYFWSPNKISYLDDDEKAIKPDFIEQLDKRLMNFRAHFDREKKVIASKPGTEFTSSNLATFIEAQLFGQFYCSELERQEAKKQMKAMVNSGAILHSSEEDTTNAEDNN